MKAAALKNLDKGRASGAHYAAHAQLPEVVGTDGVIATGRNAASLATLPSLGADELISLSRSVSTQAGCAAPPSRSLARDPAVFPRKPIKS